jgi:AraC-like DNA-binding protein
VILLWFDGRIQVVGSLTRAIPAIGIGNEVSVLRLDPEVARHWLAVPLSELTDRLISLEHISRTLASVVASLFEGGHVSSVVEAQVEAVSPRLDSRVAEARRRLSCGETVDAAASATCLSERQLERLFADAIGLSPREYRRIIRFRRGSLRQEAARDWPTSPSKPGMPTRHSSLATCVT